jgi:hypothetical protein
VTLESQEDVDNAKNFHQKNLGSRTYFYKTNVIHDILENYLGLIFVLNTSYEYETIGKQANKTD